MASHCRFLRRFRRRSAGARVRGSWGTASTPGNDPGTDSGGASEGAYQGSLQVAAMTYRRCHKELVTCIQLMRNNGTIQIRVVTSNGFDPQHINA